jgi:hypothetical protein
MIKHFPWIGLIILFLSACSGGQLPPSPTASSRPEQGIANVRQIEILKLATEPVQVRVSAQVELPDTCTTIDKVSTQKVADAFQVTITTLRSGDQVCPQTPLLVDRLIPLEVTGMPPGVYPVAVNNLEAGSNWGPRFINDNSGHHRARDELTGKRNLSGPTISSGSARDRQWRSSRTTPYASCPELR